MNKLKPRFRLIYDLLNDQWLFRPLDFYTVELVSKSDSFFPWPINGHSDTWRLSQVVKTKQYEAHGSEAL